MRFLPLLLLPLLFLNSCGPRAQRGAEAWEVTSQRVVFYNVENLFDTLDTEGVSDEEFTPNSEKEWNSERYQDKLVKLAKVLGAVGEGESPLLIGLSEVENRTVVEDLIATPPLSETPYDIAHSNSPDMRGIDVSLVYNSEAFEVLKQKDVPVHLPADAERKTRDILYVEGLLHGLDTLHVFVNHWPSRWGGQEESEPKRMAAATALRAQVDSIYGVHGADADIIIMGDFNDEPHNRSILLTLGAKGELGPAGNYGLYNLMDTIQAQGRGSYNYRGDWNVLDQMIVSSTLFDNHGPFFTADTAGGVFLQPWMMHGEDPAEWRPNRTYGGPNYYGGYSDHLPVYMTLWVKRPVQ